MAEQVKKVKMLPDKLLDELWIQCERLMMA